MAKAEKPFDPKKINQDIVKKYLQHPQLIKTLDDHILFASRENIPDLEKLADISKKLHVYPKILKVYRGSGNWKGQENTGITKEPVGYDFIFKSNDKLLSTTMDINIARAFGKTVTEFTINSDQQKCLIVDNELNYIIAERRNLSEYMTQEEVIILPPIDIKGKVIENPVKKSLLEKWFN